MQQKYYYNGLHYLPQAYRTGAEVAQVEAALNANPIDDTAFRALFDTRMRSEPLKVVGRWFARAPLLWLGTRFDIFDLHKTALPMRSPQWFALKACLFGLNALLLVAALIGAVWAFTRESPLRWLSIPIIGTALVFFPLNGFENRYSMPVYDLVLIFAAAGLVWLRERFRARPAIS